MAADRVAQAVAWAAELNAADVPTFTDPADAATNLPCVLIAPPAIEYGRLAAADTPRAVTWRFIVLGPGPGSFAAWQAIDELLDALAVHVPLTRADPGQYQLAEGQAVACYIATYDA